jgi:hypothetical protein
MALKEACTCSNPYKCFEWLHISIKLPIVLGNLVSWGSLLTIMEPLVIWILGWQIETRQFRFSANNCFTFKQGWRTRRVATDLSDSLQSVIWCIWSYNHLCNNQWRSVCVTNLLFGTSAHTRSWRVLWGGVPIGASIFDQDPWCGPCIPFEEACTSNWDIYRRRYINTTLRLCYVCPAAAESWGMDVELSENYSPCSSVFLAWCFLLPAEPPFPLSDPLSWSIQGTQLDLFWWIIDRQIDLASKSHLMNSIQTAVEFYHKSNVQDVDIPKNALMLARRCLTRCLWLQRKDVP